MREQREEGGGFKFGWEWGNRGKREREVNVGGSGRIEGRGNGVVNVGGNEETGGQWEEVAGL